MIVSVVEDHGWLLARDDAPRAAVTATGRRDRVFVIVAALFQRQALFKVLENDAVAAIGIGSAPVYQAQGLARFRR